MAELIAGLTAERVRANLAGVRERIAAAAAAAPARRRRRRARRRGKYVAPRTSACSRRPGSRRSARTARRTCRRRSPRTGDTFTWDFIGHLQSRKVKLVAPLVRLIHSVAHRLGARPAGRHARPGLRVLVEVNVAAEVGKSGVAPGDLAAFLERASVPIAGLTTMPPRADDPRDSRRWFAALRELAERHDLRALSMGTTQDFEVAVEEGATLVRIGRACSHNWSQLAGETPPRANLSRTMAFKDSWHRALVYFGLAEERALRRRVRRGARAARGPRAPTRRRAPVGLARARGRDRRQLPRAPERPPPCAAAAAPRRLRRHLRRRRAAPAAPDDRAAARRARSGPQRRRPRPPRHPQVLQRCPAGRRQVQGRDPGRAQPPGHRHRARPSASSTSPAA